MPVAIAAGLCMLAPLPAAQGSLEERARAIHGRVITLDTHADIDPANFTAQRNYTQDLPTRVTLPKMTRGGLDAVFFIVYVGQGPLTPEGYARAHREALDKFEAIHRLTAELAGDQVELALTAADVPGIVSAGKKAVLIGVENAYPVGTDLGRLADFHARGMRYLSLAHNGHSQFSDSNTGERDGWLHQGLSALGRAAIAELNRLGVMIDVSHPSRASMLQTAALSRAPIIASHSAVRALADHSRNMDDAQLMALKQNGGVIQVVAFANYVKAPRPDSPRALALQALRQAFGLPATGTAAALAALPADRRAEYDARLARIDKEMPAEPRATVRDFVDHIDYAVKLIGLDHVGISSDFDGGGGIQGWDDAGESHNVTLELVRRGYTEPEIARLWSGNLLRVMAEVERVAASSNR